MKKKILILVTTFALLLNTMLPFSRTVYADEKGVNIDELEESIRSVTDAIDKLKDVIEMGDKEAGILKSIFNGISGTFSTIGGFVGPINGSVSFLKLIGLMKDGTSEALAHIQVQLADITDKLTQMDSKLNRLSEDMMKMQATSEFNARAIKANQMSLAWHDFEANYMEDKMDELMRQYNVMVTDGIKEWIQNLPPAIENQESSEIEVPESEEVLPEENTEEEDNAVYDPYRFAVWFRCVNPGNADEGTADPEYELKIVRANGFDHDHKRDELSRPNPYIIYADDFDNKYDRGLVIDESLLPTSADIDFNIDTYREDIAGIVEAKLTEAFRNQEYSRLKTWNIYYDGSETEEIRKIADAVPDLLVYSIGVGKINGSADFSTKVLAQFREYCNHLISASQGLDAMMKTMFLTHAFEFEVAEDMENFLNQMTLKTGVYGAFASSIVGGSDFITSREKLTVPAYMCDALNKIDEYRKNAITGEGRYCYVTNTVIDYGRVTFESTARINWRRRGTYRAYRSAEDGNIHTEVITSEGNSASVSDLVGDANAMLISYLVAGNGEVFDHKYMNEHLAINPKFEQRLITSLSSQQKMTSDTDLKLKSRNVIGDYFSGEPESYLGSLPRSADFEDVVIRNMVTGTVFTPASAQMRVNRPLFGMAVYGESHNLWSVDESAFLYGFGEGGSTGTTVSEVETDSDVLLNEYMTTTFHASCEYNTLLMRPLNKASADDSALAEFRRMVYEEIGVKDEDHVHSWDEGQILSEPDEEEPGEILYTCMEDGNHTMNIRFVRYSVVSGDEASFFSNSSDPLEVKISRAPRNETTIDHFVKAEVDGNEISENDFDLKEGSLIISLKASYLKSLKEGDHTLKVFFDDGEAASLFTVREVGSPAASVNPPYRLPLTGIE